MQQWAPTVNTIHLSKGGIIESFLEQVLKAIKDLPIHEVRLLLQPYVTRLIHYSVNT